MPVVGKERPTREAELNALRRAIAVERRAYYADFQGRHSTFSQFMRQTADRLCRRYPAEPIWATVRAFFRQYPTCDVATRISIVRRTEELLAPLWDAAESQAERDAAALIATAVTAETEIVAELDPEELQASALREPQDRQVPHGAGAPDSAVHSGLARAANGAPRSSSAAQADNGAPRSSSAAQTGDGAPRSSSAAQADNGAPRQAGSSRTPKPQPGSDVKKPAAAEQAPQKFNGGVEAPVQYVKGVGPRFASVLNKMGITTVEDLLRHYPRRHLDFQSRTYIRNLLPGQEVTVFGAIRSTNAYQSRNKNVSILTTVINDGTGSVAISRFIGGKSNKYLLDRYKDQFPKGAQVIASGMTEKDRFSGRMVLKNAEVEVLGFGTEGDDEGGDSAISSIHAGRLVPVYPLTEGMSLRHLRNVIYNAVDNYVPGLEDPLPDELRSRLELRDLQYAFRHIHFPDSTDAHEDARRRLVFDELLTIQLQLAQRRYKFEMSEGALTLQFEKDGLVQRLLESLPFTLTSAQRRVFGEIARDLASTKPMHRLVQGDVGSGKTVVALLALMIAIENGYQGVMMAPTEILAEQHFRQFQRLITPLGLRTCLVIGKQGQKERREVRQQLLSGQIHIAVGTHALLEEDVEFNKLGLIIIDEQHRFGVKQRARLKAKSVSPELLTMTATPIPRTLALTMHGDLDVSEIDELPPGRKPVETKLMRAGQKKQLFQFIRKEIDSGRQAYVVFPLIEESESLSAKAATAEYEKFLHEKDFAGLSIGLMHGKLHPQEKDEVMDKFRKGEFQLLVCTTVIEVGVDVPNASVMVIENADRFGLSQLHQLRGRVGRGADQSYCFLIADAKSETTRQRLAIMEETNDGFVVAQKDLELRGPGEFLGYRQSGLPDLILADLVKDARTLELARKIAIEISKEDPNLERHSGLKKMISRKPLTAEAEIMRSG